MAFFLKREGEYIAKSHMLCIILTVMTFFLKREDEYIAKSHMLCALIINGMTKEAEEYLKVRTLQLGGMPFSHESVNLSVLLPL